MPTASQCQILNSLVAREKRRSYSPYLLDEATPDDPEGAMAMPQPETQQTFGVSPSILTPHLHPVGTHDRIRPATAQEWAERQDNSSHYSRLQNASPAPTHDTTYTDRNVSSSWGRRRSLFGPRIKSSPGFQIRDRHREMTVFQKQCMESVERSLSPRSVVPDTAQETHRQTEVEHEETVLAKMRIGLATSARPKARALEEAREIPTHVRPVVRFDSTVEVFGANQRLQQKSQPQTPVVKIIGSEVEVETPSETKPDVDVSVTSSTRDPRTDKDKTAEGGDGDGGVEKGGNDNTDQNGENVEDTDESAIVPTPMAGISLRLPVELTEEMRSRLYELGWRKPFRPKKKPKEEAPAAPTVDLSNLPSLMDLKKDPVLRKARKARVVPIQTKPPEPNPTAVCFNMLGSSLTHRDVWLAFKKDILSQHPEVKITSIHFVPRAIFVKRPKGGDPIEDRWVITFTSEWFRNRVSGMDLNFKGGAVQLRRYDDVVNCEYRQFTRMTDYMKMVSMKK